MFRRSLTRRIDVRHTCVPSFFEHPVELAFYYPRFHPTTHINAAGIPEVTDAVALMTRRSEKVTTATQKATGITSSVEDGKPPTSALPPSRWTTTVSASAKPTTDASAAEAQKDNAKSLLLLERGIDILNSVGGASGAGVANLIRPLFAARFELLNGSEHLPRCEYATHLHVQKTILKQSAALLYFNDVWDKSDVNQLDTTCVILGHFMKAFCALHPRPFHQTQASNPSSLTTSSMSNNSSTKSGVGAKCKVNSVGAGASSAKSVSSAKSPVLFDPASWKLQIGESASKSLTLPMVLERIEELLRLSGAAYGKYGKTHPELRWQRPKLLVLKALVTIPLTGHLLHAQKLIIEALTYVDNLTKRKSLLMDGINGRVQEPELGLFLLLRAEINSRIFDWDLPPEQVEDDTIHAYDEALRFYPEPYVTAIDADGIMSETHLPTRRFEAEAYACCLRSYARFLQNAPRPKATSTRDVPVFLPKQTFSLNPLLTVATSSPYIYSDIQNITPLSLERCRRRTGEALEKALKINRMLYPEARQNPTAASTLLAMACMYADTRDYLYATGLFESAKKAIVHAYGEASMEHVLVEKLRYEFLAGVGSEQEAKTASHEVVHLLKRGDSLPFM